MTNFLPKPDITRTISIRLDAEIFESVEKYAGKYNMSRNKFIGQCIEYALNHMEMEQEPEEQSQ